MYVWVLAVRWSKKLGLCNLIYLDLNLLLAKFPWGRESIFISFSFFIGKIRIIIFNFRICCETLRIIIST